MDFPLGLKRAAAMVVLRNQHKFLLLKRNKAPHLGKYVPVGGKVEPHERPKDAAIRETFEETGIRIQNPQYCGVLIETSPLKYNWQSNIYVADIDFRPPPYCDEGELAWVDYEQIPNISTPETDWHIYQYIMQGKRFALDANYNDQLELLEMEEELEGKVLFVKGDT